MSKMGKDLIESMQEALVYAKGETTVPDIEDATAPRDRTTLRLPPALLVRLTELARANRRSVNSQIVWMLEAASEIGQVGLDPADWDFTTVVTGSPPKRAGK